MNTSTNPVFVPDLRVIWLTVSNVCNLSCPFCAHGFEDITIAEMQDTDKKFMTLEEFKKIVDEIPSHTLVSLVGSGETMINPRIYEMLEYACLVKGLKVQIHTNGHFIDAERLASMGPLIMYFSLDAFEQESYARYRRGGNLALAKANLEAYAHAAAKLPPERRPRIVYKYLVNRFTEPHVEDCRAWVASLQGVEFEVYAFMIPTPSWKHHLEKNDTTTPALHEEWAPRVLKEYDIYYYDAKDDLYKNKALMAPIDGNCEHVYTELFVMVDGKAYSCCCAQARRPIEPMYFGNVLNEHVMNVFTSVQAKAFRKSYWDEKGQLPQCLTCGSNRLRNWTDAGKLDACGCSDSKAEDQAGC